MRLVTFETEGRQRAGLLTDDGVLDLLRADEPVLRAISQLADRGKKNLAMTQLSRPREGRLPSKTDRTEATLGAAFLHQNHAGRSMIQ